MSRYYFTFGVGYDLSDAYIVVDAPDENTAREDFIEARSAVLTEPRRGWSSVYTEDEFEASEYRSRYVREVPVTTPAIGSD